MPGSSETSKRKAATLPGAGPTVDVLRVLQDVTHRRSGGELVVRSPDGTGRVFVVEGRVAWAFVAEAVPRFTTRLIEGGLVTRGDVEQVVAECQRTGANFCETLVTWNLVGREPLRALLREYVAERLETILSWRSPQALFVPQTKTYLSDLTFSLEELRPEHTTTQTGSLGPSREALAPRVVLTESLMANVKMSLDEAMGIDGAVAAALVDYESGMALGTAGGGPDFNVEVAAAGNTDVVRAKMRVANQLGLPGSIEDMLITLSSQYHLIRPLRNQAGLFLYLALDRSKANLGMARFRLSQIESGFAM